MNFLNQVKRIKASSQWNARRCWREYATACKLHPEMPEYEELATAYSVLARGGELLHLAEAFKATGVHATGTPRLAIMRADGKEARYWRGYRDRYPSKSKLNTFGHHFTLGASSKGVPGKRKVVSVPIAAIANQGLVRDHTEFRTVAPLVPPRYLPASGLHLYYLLWDATWTPAVPDDPILMRHVHGLFYQVLYQWDLTELEQLALNSRSALLGRNEPVQPSTNNQEKN